VNDLIGWYFCCGIYVKDTIWKQITTNFPHAILFYSCGIYVKDTIWKQITTPSLLPLYVSSLWYLCQRYNLKANHNAFEHRTLTESVVVSMSKIQSESKSQRGWHSWHTWWRCGIYVKDTIWKQITTDPLIAKLAKLLWYLCQRYNLKANHNILLRRVVCQPVVVSMSKIQSESKSQRR